MDKATIDSVVKLADRNYALGLIHGMQMLQVALDKKINNLDPGQEEEEQVLLSFAEKVQYMIKKHRTEYSEKYNG